LDFSQNAKKAAIQGDSINPTRVKENRDDEDKQGKRMLEGKHVWVGVSPSVSQ
jgi:hypothetical protein